MRDRAASIFSREVEGMRVEGDGMAKRRVIHGDSSASVNDTAYSKDECRSSSIELVAVRIEGEDVVLMM
jgi:hypothetical protein